MTDVHEHSSPPDGVESEQYVADICEEQQISQPNLEVNAAESECVTNVHEQSRPIGVDAIVDEHQVDSEHQRRDQKQPFVIYQQHDGSCIIPAEILSSVDICNMVELDLQYNYVVHFVNDNAADTSSGVVLNDDDAVESMDMDLSHEFGNFMHFVNDTAAGDRESVGTELQLERDVEESEASDFGYGAAAMEDVSDTENVSEVEADTDVSHGSRKRKRNPEKWAKNIRKYKTQRGEAYRSAYRHEVAEKTPKPRPCLCQPDKGYKCSEFSEDERLHMCKLYWRLFKKERLANKAYN